MYTTVQDDLGLTNKEGQRLQGNNNDKEFNVQGSFNQTLSKILVD